MSATRRRCSGCSRDDKLADQWRLATERTRTGDELGVLLGGLLDLDAVEGICLATTVPPLVREWEARRDTLGGGPAARGRSRASRPGFRFATTTRARSAPIASWNAVAAKSATAPRDRRRFRDVDQLRRRVGRGGVRRRSPRTGNRDLDGCPLREGGASREGGLWPATVSDREDDRCRAPIRPRVRLRGAGGRHRAAGSAESSTSRMLRPSRPVVWRS